MKVVKVKTIDEKERYYLEDDHGAPVESVLRFIRFKDNTNYARNTLRMYCHHLKLYFEYLEQKKVDYQEITIDDLALFINWLQKPNSHPKVIPMNGASSQRTAATINMIIGTVVTFYDYIQRNDELGSRVSEKVRGFITSPSNRYKNFLYGIAGENRKIKSSILHLRAVRREAKTITKDEMEILLETITNVRDRFLLVILFETGMRIGEVLSLWLEDFDIEGQCIDLKDRGELENNAEIKTVTSPRRIDISQELMDIFMEYITHVHTEEVSTNHVFIKLSGQNRYHAMDYEDVHNLFRRLEGASGIRVTPHMLRHTSLTMLRQSGWEAEFLRVRAGHKNIYTTLNHYIHPSTEEVREAFRALKNVGGSAEGWQDE